MIKPGDEPIPGYRIEELLGQGQFGQVWRARSPGNMSLALKFLSLHGRHGWKEFRAIQRVKQIRHAHLMPIVAIWLLDDEGTIISDDALESIAADHRDLDSAAMMTKTLVAPIHETRRPAQMIVATLLANQTLGDRLKDCRAAGKKGIPADELLGYAAEAAKGLDYLNSSQHKIGDSLGAVQHCDVKPDNIMLSGGSVVICDFGVAQVLGSGRADVNATSLGGTPAYMAPECFMSKPSSTSDQYSLAVTYYELRTGRVPFKELTMAAVYAAHKEGSLDFSAVSPAEQAVLRRATATESNDRFASCAEFAERLREAVHPAKQPTRGRSWALTLALIASAIGGAVALAMLDWSGKPNGKDDDQAVVVDADGDREQDRTKDETDEPPVEDKAAVAAEYARQAEELLAAGKFDEAVTALAQAIRRDPQKYAVLPQPELRPTDGSEAKSLQVSANGKWLAAGSDSGAVRRWSLNGDQIGDGEELREHEDEVTAIAVTDEWVASIFPEAHAVTVSRDRGESFDLPTSDEQAELQNLAVAGNGRWLVATAETYVDDPNPKWTTTLTAWDLRDDDPAATRRDLFQGEETEAVLIAAHTEDWVALATLRMGDDGGDMATVRQCWLNEKRERAIHRQASSIRAVAVSHNDRWIAVGGGIVGNETQDTSNYRATIIDARGEGFIEADAEAASDAAGGSQRLQWGHDDQISALAFDAAGERLVTGGRDGDAQVWRIPRDWNPAEQLFEKPLFLTQESQAAAVRSIATPRAGWVAAIYDDRLALWYVDVENPTPLWLAEDASPVTAMTATPNGQWLVTGHKDGTVRFWPALRLMLVERACADAGEKPRASELDTLTRSDRSFPKARRSPWAHARTASGPWRRPNGASA